MNLVTSDPIWLLLRLQLTETTEVQLHARILLTSVHILTGISAHFSTTLTEGFPCFSSVVRQMLGYNSQRWGTARTYKVFIFIVMYVPLSVFCVLFVCKCVADYCHRVSTQLQLNYYYYYYIIIIQI
jgi:hypothetical protein